MHSSIYPGAYLLRCAEVEQKLGQCQQRFQEKAIAEFITPLKAFLEIDVKAVMHERKMLNVKRLDLDASRSKAKKAQQAGGEKLQIVSGGFGQYASMN